MPIFYYTAKNQKGETKSGTMKIKDEHTLAQVLREKGFVLISVQKMEQKSGRSQKDILINKLRGIFKRVSLVEKLMFTRHLAVMIGAGFSLHKALEILIKQANNLTFKSTIRDLVIRIKKGEALADSLAKYPKIFNNFYISMVRIGEKGGNLEEVLKILAQYLKKEHDFRSKVKGAMVYPGVILVTMIGIGILMMIVVVPKITAMFEELNVNLPITTRILIGISKFLSKYFLLGMIILIVLIVVLVKLAKTQKAKEILSWFFLKVPFISKMTKKINCARFARSFSSLMESGVAIIESLNITSQTLGNVFYSRSLIEIASEVKKGKSLQWSIEEYKGIYPVLVGQMIGVGEETGELSDIMERLADFYEEEVTNITDNLTSIIEPVLMIILGAIVAFFAISMIQPMYSMMQGL